MSTKPDYQPVLDVVTIDYIRFSTFDFQAYLKISEAMRRKWHGWRAGKWLQYKTQVADGNKVMYGLGEQATKPHGIFQASGRQAHLFYLWLTDNKWLDGYISSLQCTRIDLQQTKTRQEHWDYLKAYKRLREPKQIIMSETGSTLYIGNRESDSFWRIYDKTDTALRVECELKGNQAKRAWGTIKNGESISSVYRYYLKKSRVPAILAQEYMIGLDVLDPDSLVQAEDIDLETKYLWLAKLDGLVYKLANDHDLAERMFVLMNRWAEYTTKP